MIVALGSSSFAGGVIYVDGLRTTSAVEDGNSWVTSYKTLPAGLADVRLTPVGTNSHDEVRVARGGYRPAIWAPQPEYSTFDIPTGVTVYGGWNPSLSQPTPDSRDDNDKRRTILFGQVVTATGNVSVFHVVTPQPGTNMITLDGLTIRGGNAQGTVSSSPRGGGIYSIGTYLTLNRVFVEGNQANEDGGGLYFGGNPGNPEPFISIFDCEFTGNSSGKRGGAVYLETFFWDETGDPVNHRESHIYNSVFERNIGGYETNPTLVLSDGGGALFVGARNEDTELTICNCLFSENFVRGRGAAIFASDPSFREGMKIVHCTFTKNTVLTQPVIANQFIPGSVLEADGNGLLYNSIFFGNSYGQGQEVVGVTNPSHWAIVLPPGGAAFTGWHVGYSNIETGLVFVPVGGLVPYVGDGNINRTTVGFTGIFDFTLDATSPCLDMGTTQLSLSATTVDLPGDFPDVDGDNDFTETIWYAFDVNNPRVTDLPGVGGCINPGASTCADNDMGCYERQ